MPDETYSNELPSGPTLEERAGSGLAPTGADSTPATGVASAPGGGAIDAALVGTDTEVLGAGSDGGDARDEKDPDVDAVTGTGAGAGELDPLQTGTAQGEDDGGQDGFGGRTMDAAARNSTMPHADTQSRSVD